MCASRSLSFHRITLIALVLLTLTFLSRDALTHVLHSARAYLASESQAGAQRSESDTGGQTASPNPSGGRDQEERMRQLLAQDYEQRFGGSDQAIRAALEIRGKVADFVGYNARSNQWLIAESKASNISDAVVQLENTAKGLLAKYPGANVELRIYLDGEHFQQLANGDKIYGWMINTERYLGFPDEAQQFIYQLARGIKILVQAAPSP